MSRSRIWLVVVAVAAVSACVEQESFRPTADDKKIIKENILSKAPTVKHKVNADLEGKVVYVGLDVDKDVIKPGETFKVVHYWQVKKAVTGWKLFVHLNSPDKKGFVNADHVPIGGRYPVTRWKPGQVIRDEQPLTLPANWKHSKVVIYTGLWKGKLRMKVTSGPKDEEGRVVAATLPTTAKDAPPPKLPRLVAARSAEAVKVDGTLDEPVWTKAPTTGLFLETMAGGKADTKTEARMAYDDKNLYIAFRAEDEDVWSSFKKRDDKLWTEEAVEVFIDANGDGKDYIELQVNPNGAIFDSFLPSYRKNQNDWNSGMTVGVAVEGTVNKRDDKDKTWTVEIAIPWADTVGKSKAELSLPPKVGDVWRINFFRLDLPKGKPQRAAAWSPPLVGDFHKLDRFGEVVFGDAEGKAPKPTTKEEPAKEAKEAKAAPPADEKLPPGVIRMKMPPQEKNTIRSRLPPMGRPK